MDKMVSRTSGFLIDWFTVVFHGMTVNDVRNLLHLGAYTWQDNFKHINGYPRYVSFGNINIRFGCEDPLNYGGDESKIRHDMGVCLDMSGKGCRTFESFAGAADYSWLDLFKAIDSVSHEHKVHITRIDLSYDDFDGLLDIWEIASDVLDRNFTGSPKSTKVLISDNQLTNVQGCTCYIGSDGSDVKLRIYDKLAERISADSDINSIDAAEAVSEECPHWVRVELVLRDDRAGSAFNQLLQHDFLGSVFLGVVRTYCVFRVPSGDSNKSRWDIAPYWDAFLANCEKVQLWVKPGVPYDVVRSAGVMLKQYGQLLAVIQRTKLFGGLAGLVEKVNAAYPKLNKKYQQIIDDLEARELLAAELAVNEKKQKEADLRSIYAWMLDAGATDQEFNEFIADMVKK